MTSEQERIAKAETKIEDLERRIGNMEQAEVWRSRTIIGLLMTAAFNIYTKFTGSP